jgi:pyruvate/2-oxoglutarate dehydrogenase complex dihydrolipoamide dehydrogenase (E3) component
MVADQKPDLCIIGADHAGVDLAMAAALLGAPVALIVPHPLPSAVVAGASAAQLAAELRLTGLGRAIGHELSAERLIACGIRLLVGPAHFTARDTLVVETQGEGTITLKARRFVLATGVVADEVDCETLSGQPFSITLCAEPPPVALVVGEDAPAVAIAQALHKASSRVTLWAPGGFLPQENAEAARLIASALARQDIPVITDQQKPDIAEATTIIARYKPALGGLNLEAAGITLTNGIIPLDAKLRSDNSRLYAVGDVAGLSRGIGTGRHLGSLHARFMVRHLLFRAGGVALASPVLQVAGTMPPLARVGLDEKAARAAGGKIYRFAFSALPGQQDEVGFVAIMADRKGKVLGAHAVGDGAAEALAPVALAMANGVPLASLQTLALPFPMAGEAVRRAASIPVLASLRKPGVKLLARLLRFLG